MPQKLVGQGEYFVGIFALARVEHGAVDKIICAHHRDADDADNDAEGHHVSDYLHRQAHADAQNQRPENPERVREDRGGAARRFVQLAQLFQLALLGVFARVGAADVFRVLSFLVLLPEIFLWLYCTAAVFPKCEFFVKEM